MKHFENYIFSGTGYAFGKYKITNKELEEAVNKKSLEGFNSQRVELSKGYIAFKEKNPETSPFSYFVGEIMGFETRNHVVPFPPTFAKAENKDTALELAVEAVGNALKNSGIHPEKIDKWFFSNATGHEQAPGIAATVKCFFVDKKNQKPAFTVNSACVGFNINIQNAIEFLKCNPEAKHVIVAHTEVMSGLLNNTTDFVPFATFADAAAAVVLSKKESENKEGIISVCNKEDMHMIDFLGADKKGNLYMGAGQVKIRATENIANISKEVLKKAGTDLKEIDLLIPHQTGNAIVLSAVKKLNFPVEKVYQEVQKKHGNLSGASIPVSISKLFEEKRLKQGDKILCSTAGLGGEFGAFLYIVPKIEKSLKINYSQDLKGKTAILTGCTGDLGFQTAVQLAARSCNLILQYNSNDKKAEKLKGLLKNKNTKLKFIKTNFLNKTELDNFILNISEFDYLIHTAGVTGKIAYASDISENEMLSTMKINALSPIELTKRLFDKFKPGGTIIYIGSAAEDAQFAGNSDYIASKKALHGFAVSFSDEAKYKNITTIYYMPGIIAGKMANKLNKKQLINSLSAIKQEKILQVSDVSERIVKSLYLFKIKNVKDNYENSAVIRRDGFLTFCKN